MKRKNYKQGRNTGSMELGLRIHGEPGVSVVPLQGADAVVGEVLAAILDKPSSTLFSSFASASASGSSPVDAMLMVNNLGSTTNLELGVIVRAATARLKARGINVKRVVTGTLMTSLAMTGFSLSLQLPSSQADSDLLDAPCGAAAWPEAA